MMKKNLSKRNFFSDSVDKELNVFWFTSVAIFFSVFAVTVLIILGITVYKVIQFFVDQCGYLLLPLADDILKGALTAAGTASIASVALYGVLTQNRSAEDRHRADAKVALRKDILLEVAEAYAMQVQFLTSFANPDVTNSQRQKMIKNGPKAFFKLQAVADIRVIEAMLEANRAWMLVVADMSKKNLTAPCTLGPLECLERLEQIMRTAEPYSQKLWVFNALAREDVGAGFADHTKYLDLMLQQYLQVPDELAKARQSI
jgi:hypothetical protein